MDSVGEGEGGMIWENGIETCIISYEKWNVSPSTETEEHYYMFSAALSVLTLKSPFLILISHHFAVPSCLIFQIILLLLFSFDTSTMYLPSPK